MKTANKFSLVLLYIVLLAISSCSKYEDGSFSLQSKTSRLINIWSYDKMIVDGQERRLSDDEKATTFEFKKNNIFENKMVSGGKTYTITGKWEFISDKEKVKITNDSNPSNVLELIITRLKSDEFWCKEIDGSSTTEVHFKSK